MEGFSNKGPPRARELSIFPTVFHMVILKKILELIWTSVHLMVKLILLFVYLFSAQILV